MQLYPGEDNQCLSQGNGFGKDNGDGFETCCSSGDIHRTLWPIKIRVTEKKELKMISIWVNSCAQH